MNKEGNKKNNKERIFLLSVIIILGIILYFKGCGNKEPKKEIVKYNYITDTVYQDRPYRVNKLIIKETPPITLTKWKTDTVKVEIEVIPNYLLVKLDSLKDSLKISQQFLAKYPHNNKLIDFNLNKDSFDIALLDTGGNILSKKYPIDLNHYRYQWYNNDLHHKKIPYKDPRKKSDFKALYLSMGYEPFLKAPSLDLSYNLNINRFKLGSSATMFFSNDPMMVLQAKIGFRLLK